MRFSISDSINKLHIIYTETSSEQKVSLISFVVEMFTDMHINFEENRTTGYWDISDLASLIYTFHPVDSKSSLAIFMIGCPDFACQFSTSSDYSWYPQGEQLFIEVNF